MIKKNTLPPVELTNSVENFLSSVNPGEKVVVACSGGADSLALAWTVQFVASKKSIFVYGLIVDHQLSEESHQVALTAQDKLNQLNLLENQIIKVEVVDSADGIEAAARKARYQALGEYADQIQARQVYLGHTLEDQVETVLMRLTRGSGARSLQAMAETNGIFVRPFLHLPRDLVRGALNLIEMSAWEDPMNFSERFLRSRIRNNLLPKLKEVLGESVFEAIDRTALQIREDNQALDLITKEALILNSIDRSAKVDILMAQPKAIRTRMLRHIILQAGAPAASLANVHIEAVNQLVDNWHGQGEIALPGKLRAIRRNDEIFIEVKNN